MSSILDVSNVRQRVHPLSVEAYHTLADLGFIQEAAELIRGIVIDKMPKSPLHVWLVKWLYKKLQANLPEHMDLRKEEPLSLKDSEPEPDLAVAEGEMNVFRKNHPSTARLVIEVSVSTQALDRAKAALYAEAGVPEYWLVDGEAKQVSVYRNPVNGLYQKEEAFGNADNLVSTEFPEVTIPLAELFVN